MEDDEIELSESQLAAYKKITAGKNIFLTGAGGVGKSAVIKKVVADLKKQGKVVVVMAPTGVAAVNIGGQTLHSVMGLPLKKVNEEQWLGETLSRMSKARREKYQSWHVVVIDECSMMDGQAFTLTHMLLSAVREAPGVFGGVQMLLVGDFAQLPPISSPPLFLNPLFWRCVEERCELVEVWRQKDPTFIHFLHRLRFGECTAADIALLQSRVNAPFPADGIEPLQLFALNAQVDAGNAKRMETLPGPAYSFATRSGCSLQTRQFKSFRGAPKAAKPDTGRQGALDYMKDRLVKDVDGNVSLKVGATVMLTANIDVDGGLANGVLGKVIRFTTTTKTRKPGEQCEPPDPFSEFDNPLRECNTLYPDECLPVVAFDNGSGELDVREVPYFRVSREEQGLGQAWVWRVPLRVAFFASIHKSQGVSVTRLRLAIDANVRAHGQAYVGASRCRSLQGLSIVGSVCVGALKADPRVVAFYRNSFKEQRAAALSFDAAPALGSSPGSAPVSATQAALSSSGPEAAKKGSHIPFVPVTAAAGTAASKSKTLAPKGAMQYEDADSDME